MSIASVLKDFDKYINQTIQKKQDNQQLLIDQSNIITNSNFYINGNSNTQNGNTNTYNKSVNDYLQALQKRIKNRTSGQNQKFQKLIRPMRKLKTFLSIKQFIQRIPQNYNLQTSDDNNNDNNNLLKINQNQKILKMEYQDLRGGYYMQKIQQHLKDHNMIRTLDKNSLKLLQSLQCQPIIQNSQYRKWMENAINNINPIKQQLLFSTLDYNYLKSCDHNLFDKKTHLQIKNHKGRKLSARYSNIYKSQRNFSRVSDFLSTRLKKILIDKYVCVGKRDTNTDKKTKMIINSCKEKNLKKMIKPKTAVTRTGSMSTTTITTTFKKSHFVSQPQSNYNHKIINRNHKNSNRNSQPSNNNNNLEHHNKENTFHHQNNHNQQCHSIEPTCIIKRAQTGKQRDSRNSKLRKHYFNKINDILQMADTQIIIDGNSQLKRKNSGLTFSRCTGRKSSLIRC